MGYIFTQLGMTSIFSYLWPRKTKFKSLLSHITDAIDVGKAQVLSFTVIVRRVVGGAWGD